MILEADSARELGWDRVLEHLAGLTATPQGQALARALRPRADLESLLAAQDRVRELERLRSEGRPPPLEALEDVEADLARAEKGGTLAAEAILRVAAAMQASSRARRYLLEQGGRLVELAQASCDLSGPGRDLAQAFDAEGQLRDSASPELVRRRREARGIADGIRAQLERLMRQERIARALGEDYFTQRGDRYVLPVRASARGELPGIVHDASQTGQTLFVEPQQIVEDGNRLIIARAAALEEETRILAEYSGEIASRAEALRANLACLAGLDLVSASCRLGERLRGLLPELEPGSARAGFDLRAARHPLMLLEASEPAREVVPNDIRLGPGQRALLLTGPNAGGKTVVLKTVGLCCLMAQAGLPIPAAEGSRLALFERLGAVIGDAQDLHQGLSTFSAHVVQIGRILATAGPGSLVLLDEIAADTDPRHGAALAAALLEELVERGACLVVTTHFEQLKQLPYADARFANAAVGFDLQALVPTFRLHPDVPGRSLTLDIARRLGLPEAVLARARARLDPDARHLEQVLEGLEAERQALEAQRGDLAEETRRAAEAARESQTEAEALAARRAELMVKGREQILAEIATARREVAEVIEGLKRGPDMPRAVESSQRLIGLERTLEQARGAAAAPARQAPGPEAGPIEVGDRVHLARLGQVGEVTVVDRHAGMLTVQLGVMRTRVPVEAAERVPGEPPRARAKARQAQAAPLERAEVRGSHNSLDVRGLRVDEALDELEKFLDRLFAANEPAAFVVHGHGTGALRAAIRAHLKRSAYARRVRPGTPEEGGDGVTVASLE